jgi:CheY-like chemotaxis protein/anti-sigma regulatory factor (Ser/Thr protein kinase)
VARQIASLRELVDDLLDVARVTSGKITLNRRPIDLGRVARRTVTVLSGSGRLGKHRVEVACDEAWVDADETRLEQVVTNLLDNAVKYTPEGGRIALRVHAEGDDVLLQVEDSGMGIAPDLLPRVFDLFSQGERTLDRSQGGLGLGLALVRRLAELHGGEVTATSRGVGEGACFTVRLARVEAPPATSAAAPPEAEDAKGLRILVVEDNPDGRETLVMLLNMQGHEVHEADTGPSGVERALDLKPDAAVVDIGLPGFDGYEVARRLRSSPIGGDIRLIALTGYGQEEDRQNAFRAGFDSFLVKPADMNALNTILAAV